MASHFRSWVGEAQDFRSHALRTVGVALPVVVLSNLGQTYAGIMAGIAALYAGLASFDGISPARLQRMAASTVLMALSGAIGAWASSWNLAAVIVTLVIALVAGLGGSFGPNHNRAALHVTAVCVLTAGAPIAGGTPLVAGLAVLAGGLCQTVICLLLEPVNPYKIEREAVARAFSDLADFARKCGTDRPDEIPATEAMMAAAELMEQAARFGLKKEHGHLVRATQVAETVRAAFVGYARTCGGMASAPHQALAQRLERVALSIRVGDWGLPQLLRDAPREGLTEDAAYWLDLIEGELAKVGEAATAEEVAQAEGEPLFGLRALIRTQLLDRIRLSQAARYAVFAGGAMAVARMVPIDRAYWFPLTVVLILRSSYSATLTRGVSRLVGTVLGVAVATAIELVVRPSPNMLVWLTVVSVWLVFTTLSVNYSWLSFAVTLFVVFLLSSRGAPEFQVSLVRLGATLLGAFVSYLATLVWPIWESKQVSGILAEAFTAQATYGEEVLKELEGTTEPQVVVRRRMARALRMEAEKLVGAASMEPRRGQKRALSDAKAQLAVLSENAAEMLSAHALAVAGNLSPAVHEKARVRLAQSLARARELSVQR